VFPSGHSSFLKINAGVLQGSILGPLLFLVFTHDIDENFESDESLYADDCTLLHEYHNSTVAESTLNSDLLKVGRPTWAKQRLVTFTFFK